MEGSVAIFLAPDQSVVLRVFFASCVIVIVLAITVSIIVALGYECIDGRIRRNKLKEERRREGDRFASMSLLVRVHSNDSATSVASDTSQQPTSPSSPSSPRVDASTAPCGRLPTVRAALAPLRLQHLSAKRCVSNEQASGPSLAAEEQQPRHMRGLANLAASRHELGLGLPPPSPKRPATSRARPTSPCSGGAATPTRGGGTPRTPLDKAHRVAAMALEAHCRKSPTTPKALRSPYDSPNASPCGSPSPSGAAPQQADP